MARPRKQFALSDIRKQLKVRFRQVTKLVSRMTDELESLVLEKEELTKLMGDVVP